MEGEEVGGQCLEQQDNNKKSWESSLTLLVLLVINPL
jgi:hypothetical protein